MYVPHYDAILHAIGTNRAEVEARREVTVPTSLLKFLLQVAVASGEFNEDGYLATNPDVSEAVRSGAVADPRLHYIAFGFFEGRRGATPQVDENWYRRTYSDVGAAINAGQLGSAGEHFAIAGAEEFRAPSEPFQRDVREWKAAVGKAA